MIPPGESSEPQDTSQRLEAMELLLEAQREALRLQYDELRTEQARFRRDYDDRLRELTLASGLEDIRNTLMNGFDDVMGQLRPLNELRPPTGEVGLSDDTASRFARLQRTQRRIPANSYQVPLVEYDVGFLNDPRALPPAGGAGSHTQKGLSS